MKKYLTLSFVVFFTVFLSGCSTDTSSTGSTPAVAVKKPSSVLKSVDGGKTWEFKSDASGKINMDAMDILSLSINPHNNQNIFAGTLKNGILKTEDGGENWKGTGLPVEKVYGIVNSYEDGRVVYATGVLNGRGKIFKSLDGGVVWDEIYTAPSDGPLVIALEIDRRNSNVLLAATSDNQVIKSSDAGVSWKNIYASSGPIVKLSIDSGNSNVLYASTLDGSLFVTRNGGETFEELKSENIQNGTSLVMADPNNSGWIFAAGKAGLFRSKNAGGAWEEIKTLSDPDTFPVNALAISPGNSREFVYGAGQAVYKSIDDGGNWMPFQLDTSKNISAIMYDATDPNILYLGLKKK